MTQIHTDEQFDDDVFRAIAEAEAQDNDNPGEFNPNEDPARPDLPIQPEAVETEHKPKKASVREAVSLVDQRFAALAEWLDHLEGVEPISAWESDPDDRARRIALRIIRDTDAGWRVESALAEHEHHATDESASWGPVSDLPILDRVRALRLGQSILRDVVEQQRRLIIEIRSAVKEFDTSAASMGVKINR